MQGILLFILLAAVGWVVLAYFTYEYAPTTLTVIGFFALLWPTVTATLTPLLYAARRRLLKGDMRAHLSAALREAALLASLLVIWGILILIEAFNWVAVLIMLGVVVLLEARLLLRR